MKRMRELVGENPTCVQRFISALLRRESVGERYRVHWFCKRLRQKVLRAKRERERTDHGQEWMCRWAERSTHVWSYDFVGRKLKLLVVVRSRGSYEPGRSGAWPRKDFPEPRITVSHSHYITGWRRGGGCGYASPKARLQV